MPNDSQTAPNTDNYAVGKGKLYIATWTGSTPSYSEMGNCPSIEVEPTLEKLPHYSSQSGYKTKDKNPITQTDYNVNFDCDEITTANLSKFLMGTQSSESNGPTILGLQASDTEYALQFVSDNPVGPDYIWTFHKCTITPNGAISLIGEEWMAMSYTAEGLADTANQASSPYFNVRAHTTTTTSTTSSSSSTTPAT